MTENDSIVRQVWLRSFLKIIDIGFNEGSKLTLKEAIAAADYVADHFENRYPDTDPDTMGVMMQ